MNPYEGMTSAQLFMELENATQGQLPADEWRRVLAMPTELQAATLANYKAAAWTKPTTPAGAKVLAVLDVIGRIGSDVSAAAGAVTAAAAIAALL